MNRKKMTVMLMKKQITLWNEDGSFSLSCGACGEIDSLVVPDGVMLL